MQSVASFRLSSRPLVARPSVAPGARRAAVCVSAEGERFRLNNIGPAPGSRRDETRKGRGYGAGQGATCGYGMRGQLARSGPATRPGFEGGQIPLYRRMPKLKGIAGGMGAGLPDNVTINLKTLAEKFAEGDEISLQTLKDKDILNVSGRERRLGLKILGDGDLPFPLTITAESFSESAKTKIEAAGGKAVVAPKRKKWTRKAHEARMRAAKKGKAASGGEK